MVFLTVRLCFQSVLAFGEQTSIRRKRIRTCRTYHFVGIDGYDDNNDYDYDDNDDEDEDVDNNDYD